MPSVAIIIPARYASQRFPGKPLAMLRGATGEAKPLIQRSWECAAAIPGTLGAWVATDDPRIADRVRQFGGQVVMTAPECANGTERCADAMRRLGAIADIVVNLQGDAPLSPGDLVGELVARLGDDPDAVMATPAVRCSPTMLAHLLADQAAGRVGGTTVVCDDRDRALYFSKRVIPYLPEDATRGPGAAAVHLHLGMYAYRPDALAAYAAGPAGELERLEGLEQLRFLALGLPVAVVRRPPLAWDAIELNNPQDVPVIEAVLRARGIA